MINENAQPFAEHDTQEQQIIDLQLQVSDLYSQMRLYREELTSMLQRMNGKDPGPG